MEVVIVPKAVMASACKRPWPELIEAARRGDDGLTVMTEYQERVVHPQTRAISFETRQIVGGMGGSPLVEKTVCPSGHAMLYEHDRMGTALCIQRF